MHTNMQDAYAYAHEHTHTHTRAHTHIHTHTHTHTHKHTNKKTRTHTHKKTHTHTCTYIHTSLPAVDDELAALKKGSKSAPVGALPAGQGQPDGKPMKDVFDMELEALRKKARE